MIKSTTEQRAGKKRKIATSNDRDRRILTFLYFFPLYFYLWLVCLWRDGSDAAIANLSSPILYFLLPYRSLFGLFHLGFSLLISFCFSPSISSSSSSFHSYSSSTLLRRSRRLFTLFLVGRDQYTVQPKERNREREEGDPSSENKLEASTDTQCYKHAHDPRPRTTSADSTAHNKTKFKANVSADCVI